MNTCLLAVTFSCLVVTSLAATCTPDEDKMCCEWASGGECETNPYWMKVSCQTACGTCGATVADASTISTKVSPTCAAAKTGGDATTVKPAAATTVKPVAATTVANVAATTIPATSGDSGSIPKMPFDVPEGWKALFGWFVHQVQTGGISNVAPPVPVATTAAVTKPVAQVTTIAATMAATPAPTMAATPAPTMAATPAPTIAATPAPTMAATPAPTMAATPAPTKAATPAPTMASATTMKAVVTTAKSGSGTTGCKNTNALCNFWAHVDECKKNPTWMLPNCKKACKKC